MEDKILIEVLKLFEKTPNALLLIMFCLYGVKKYVINNNIQKLLDIQKQRSNITNEILKVMMRIEEREQENHKQLRDVLGMFGSRKQNLGIT